MGVSPALPFVPLNPYFNRLRVVKPFFYYMHSIFISFEKSPCFPVKISMYVSIVAAQVRQLCLLESKRGHEILIAWSNNVDKESNKTMRS